MNDAGSEGNVYGFHGCLDGKMGGWGGVSPCQGWEAMFGKRNEGAEKGVADVWANGGCFFHFFEILKRVSKQRVAKRVLF